MMNWLSYRMKVKRSHVGCMACILILLIPLSACTGPTFPTGSFSMESDDDYVMEFSEDGTFIYYYDEMIATRGTYSIQGDQWIVETDQVCDAEDSGKATYLWTYENDTLTFTLKGEDRCQSRREVLDNITYVKDLSTKSIQQNKVEESVEHDLAAGEVITPEDADQLTPNDLSTTEPAAIIWDDDGSLDGVIALLYFLADPATEVKAATISPGIAHPHLFAPQLAAFFKKLGVDGTPIAAGPEKPLSGDNAFPKAWRSASDRFWGVELPQVSKSMDEKTAAELILEMLHEPEEPVIIFVSGPLTNLAEALRIDPSIKDQIRSVEIMGGALEVNGNVENSPSAEWNIYIDPVAAKEVFTSGLDIYLTPLDATDRILWREPDAAAWAASKKPTGSTAADLLRQTMEDWSSSSVLVWDLVAALNVVDRGLCQWEEVHAEVIQDGVNLGQTVIDKNKPPNVHVCLNPDSDAYHTLARKIFAEK